MKLIEFARVFKKPHNGLYVPFRVNNILDCTSSNKKKVFEIEKIKYHILM